MIRAYLKGEQSEWDLHLGCLTTAFRSSESESTGLTPNMLMLGSEVRTPLELQFGHTSEKSNGAFGFLSSQTNKIRVLFSAESSSVQNDRTISNCGLIINEYQ
jgi:hypothetical protein